MRLRDGSAEEKNLSFKGWIGIGCTDKSEEHFGQRGAIKIHVVFGGIASNLGRLKGEMGGK